MQNILYLISRFGAFITFVILEVLCIYLVVQYNDSQKSIFLNSTSIYRGQVSEEIMSYGRYFSLRDVNDSLARENALLLSQVVNKEAPLSVSDTIEHRYIVKRAEIVNNGIRRRNNHMTIDVGSSEGVEPGMGIAGASGILGIVTHTTEDYALANSILHSQTKISCTVQPYSYPGSLVWKDDNFQFMTLESIPKHVSITQGDTVVTNGFSTIFPKDIIVGTVEDYFINEGQGTYEIKVRLVNDIANAHVGYVIMDKDVEQLKTLDSLAYE